MKRVVVLILIVALGLITMALRFSGTIDDSLSSIILFILIIVSTLFGFLNSRSDGVERKMKIKR
jgi:hypothetical protein